MLSEDQLNELEMSFSNSQRKLLQEVSPLVGHQPAVALVSLKGSERTSLKEISVIAHIISQFKPIKIEQFNESPRRIILVGQLIPPYEVEITPQKRIPNNKPGAQPWAVDLVINLTLPTSHGSTSLASVGIEYDEYPIHYLESSIKRQNKRDIHILSEHAIPLIRISPEYWKADGNGIKKAIRKFLRNAIEKTEKIKRLAKKSEEVGFKKLPDNYFSTAGDTTDCPVCEGQQFIGIDYCRPCHGMGRMPTNIAKSISLSDHEVFTCPDCRGKGGRCKTCLGSGSISREQAIKISKNKP